MSLKDAYPSILETYLKIAQKLAKDDAVILKTDAFNEAMDRPVEGGIAGNIKGTVKVIETRADYVAHAVSREIDAEIGDIRYLEFKDETFDLILDFSTIDHVRQWRVVLKGYQRVLKKGGTISLVYWAKGALAHDKGQFYFPEGPFEKDFAQYFTVKSKQIIYSDKQWDGIRRLIHLVGTRPGTKKRKTTKKTTTKRKKSV